MICYREMIMIFSKRKTTQGILSCCGIIISQRQKKSRVREISATLSMHRLSCSCKLVQVNAKCSDPKHRLSNLPEITTKEKRKKERLNLTIPGSFQTKTPRFSFRLYHIITHFLPPFPPSVPPNALSDLATDFPFPLPPALNIPVNPL